MLPEQEKKEGGAVSTTTSSKSNLPPRETSLKAKAKAIIPTNFLAFVTCSFLTENMNQILKTKTVLFDDLPVLPMKLRVKAGSEALDSFWNDFNNAGSTTTPHPPPSLGRALWTKAALECLLIFFFKLLTSASNLILPIFVQSLLVYLDPSQPTSSLLGDKPLVLAFIIFGLQVLALLLEQGSDGYQRVLKLRFTNILADAIYLKSFRLSNQSRQEFSDGRILNMINNDVSEIVGGFISIGDVVLHLGQLALTFYLVWTLLGNSFFVGLGVVVVLGAISIMGGAMAGPLFKNMLTAKDERISVTGEMIRGMRIVKYRSLEGEFEERIKGFRNTQIHNIRWLLITLAGAQSISFTIPAVVLAISIPLYCSFNNGVFLGSVIFPAILYINNMLTPLMSLPVLRDATFQWPKEKVTEGSEKSSSKEVAAEKEDEKPVFSVGPVSLAIPRGAKVVVIGQIGQGKSTLFEGILGNVELTSGNLEVNGSVSYSSQTPWLMSGSIKENILFGLDEDQERLERAIQDSCLVSDLATFPAGINSLLGENGISLSGGQKSRLSLARTLYRDAEIVFLDCPLASLDAKVANETFENGIVLGLMAKTVIMATHKLSLVTRFEYCIVMQEGKVAEYGSTSSLLEGDGILKAMVDAGGGDTSSSIEASSEILNDQEISLEKGKGKEEVEAESFLEEEEMKTGSVSKAIWETMKCMGLTSLLLAGMAALFHIATVIGSSYILLIWTQNASANYTSWYVVVSLLSMIAVFLILLASIHSSLTGAVVLHNQALSGVLRASIEFFDRNPAGRILNRFSSDVNSIDMSLFNILLNVIITGDPIIATLVIVALASPFLLLLPFVIGPPSYYLFCRFRASNLALQRLVSVYKSPLDAIVSSSLTGMTTLKVFKVEKLFIEKQREKLDDYQQCQYIYTSVRMWFTLRVGLLSSLVTLSVVVLASQSSHYSVQFAAQIGVSLTYSATLTNYFMALLFFVGSIEAEVNAAERLLHYATSLPQEPARSLATDPSSSAWPKEGGIEINNLSISYPSRPDHKVVKNLNLSIRPGEKVGIVGRTGSGKSTLMSVLFRMINDYEGGITIDGIEIKSLGLKTLRQSLFMVPQEPVIFKGTIRSNISTSSSSGTFSDAEVWEALKLCGLFEYVSSLPEKLDSPIDANGSNLSLGQKQALTIVEAVLLKPKILVFDESTSAMDSKTDQLIQSLVQGVFKDSTVLSIAHRLSTIVGFDRVLVMADGEKMECEKPSVLLKDPQSLFRQLAQASGELDLLLSLAQ